MCEIEEPLNLPEKTHCLSQISVLLLGISLYSYHVRELLVCLAFFSLLFVLLALLILGGIIAWHAGEYVLQRAGTAGRVRRSVALGPAELQLKPILGAGRMTRV